MEFRTIGPRAVAVAAIGALCLAAVAQAQVRPRGPLPSQVQPAKKPRPPAGGLLKEPSTPEELAAARPDPQAPGFRVPLPPLEQMDAETRADFEYNARRLKTPVPPTGPLMLTPGIKANVSRVLGPVGETPLPQDLYQLTILMAARHWGAQFPWWVHHAQTVAEGVPAEAVEALRTGRRPVFATPAQEATYRYFVELFRDHRISEATYQELHRLIGTEQLVAITELGGYYSRLSMTLIAHNVPLRSDVTPPLPPLDRTFP